MSTVTREITGSPAVNVPVLSSTTTSVSANRSIATADFTSTPCLLAFAIADNSGGMVASTTAHGDATIMNVMARNSVERKSAPNISGTVSNARVATTTPAE